MCWKKSLNEIIKQCLMFLGILSSYLLLAFVAFGNLPLTFFQQDEWAIFGNYLYWDKANLDWINRLFIFEQYTHLIPFSNLLSYAQFKLFGLNFFPYGVFSIGIQFINSILVMYLCNLLTNNKKMGFIAGILFLTASVSHQAITWVATTTGTAGSIFFLLLSLIFVTKSFLRKEHGNFYLAVGLLLFFISLGFKETTLFVLLFIPLFRIILFRKSRCSLRKITFFLFCLGFVYILVRILFSFTGSSFLQSTTEFSQPSIPTYFYRVFSMPLKVLVQSIVPSPFIIAAGNKLINVAYPQFVASDRAANPYLVESAASDIIIFGLASILLSFCVVFIYYYRKIGLEEISRTIIVAVLFIMLSALPLIAIPGKAGYFSIVDGRHLYITNIFTSILLTLLGFGFYKMFKAKKIVFLIIMALFIAITAWNVQQIRNDIDNQILVGNIRKNILLKISSLYPLLPNRVVFYIESDKAYYGLPESEKIVPFQSGFGQTLLIWYDNRGQNFPNCFFVDQFLYVQLSEGYRECQERGFGYFRRMDLLKNAIESNALSPENVIAFRFNSHTNSLDDITTEIRKKLE